MPTRSVERAGDRASTAVTAAVRELLAASRAPHRGVQAQLDELARLFHVLLDQRCECVFTVRGTGILVDGERWEETPDLASALAFKLRRRRIRRLTIRTGITRKEVLNLVALLSIDHQELLREGGLDAFVRSATPNIDVEMLAVDEPSFVAASTEGSAIQSERTDFFHDPHENSLLILCELMVSSEEHEEYRSRREAFLAAFSDQRFSSAAIARILGYIATDLPAPRFEHRDNLVSDVLDGTEDEEALVLFLCSMAKQPDVARPILSRLIMRASPFALLVRLMRAPLLASFRHLLCDKFLEAGRLKHDALVRWAREHSEGLFHPEVFDALLSRPELLGPICKDILNDGSKPDRGRLIERLEAEGNETALRLLVLGMPYDDKPCDPRLLTALASFRHPLAVSTLREVIHRNNLRRVRSGEVSTAFRSLNRIGLEKGCAFLREVVQRRAFMLPLYRRKLRQIATLILEGKEVPILE